MENNSQIRGDARIRLLIAELVAEHFKAYDLPMLGERLGLAPGTEQEAFSSKKSYMSSRLNALNHEQLREVAQELSRDIANSDLDQFLNASSPLDASISQTLDRFDKNIVHARWTAAIERRKSDPEGAITLARTLLEDVMKWILTKEQIQFGPKADLPKLYRLVADHLNLAPDAHNEDVFKRILGSCQSVVESLGTLRNRLSDAHSPGPLRAKPQSRHAELAVNLAGTMATFLVATWESSKS